MDQCYCIEIFRKTHPDVEGACLKQTCGRWRREERKKEEESNEDSKRNVFQTKR